MYQASSIACSALWHGDFRYTRHDREREVRGKFSQPVVDRDLQPAVAASLNVGLAAEIERLDCAAPQYPGRRQLADAAGPVIPSRPSPSS